MRLDSVELLIEGESVFDIKIPDKEAEKIRDHHAPHTIKKATHKSSFFQDNVFD